MLSDHMLNGIKMIACSYKVAYYFTQTPWRFGLGRQVKGLVIRYDDDTLYYNDKDKVEYAMPSMKTVALGEPLAVLWETKTYDMVLYQPEVSMVSIHKTMMSSCVGIETPYNGVFVMGNSLIKYLYIQELIDKYFDKKEWDRLIELEKERQGVSKIL